MASSILGQLSSAIARASSVRASLSSVVAGTSRVTPLASSTPVAITVTRTIIPSSTPLATRASSIQSQQTISRASTTSIRAPTTLLTFTPLVAPSIDPSISSTERTAATTSAISEPQPDPGLSTGAKAGIGIGAASGFLLLVGLLFFFWRRRKAKSTLVETAPVTNYAPLAMQPELVVPKHEKSHNSMMKSELYSTTTTYPPAPAFSPAPTMSPPPAFSPPPMYNHFQPTSVYNPVPNQSQIYELATPYNPSTIPRAELSGTPNAPQGTAHTMPPDVGPAIAIHTPHNQSMMPPQHRPNGPVAELETPRH